MSTTSLMQRTRILEAVRARLEAKFGAHGTIKQLLRVVVRSPWKPGGTVRPKGWVVDTGVKRGGGAASDETKNRTGSFQVILDLKADWDRDASMDDWTEHVERISVDLQNAGVGAGCSRLDYLSDDPVEVTLTKGPAQFVWVIEFEYDYAVECGEFGKQ